MKYFCYKRTCAWCALNEESGVASSDFHIFKNMPFKKIFFFFKFSQRDYDKAHRCELCRNSVDFDLR